MPSLQLLLIFILRFSLHFWYLLFSIEIQTSDDRHKIPIRKQIFYFCCSWCCCSWGCCCCCCRCYLEMVKSLMFCLQMLASVLKTSWSWRTTLHLAPRAVGHLTLALRHTTMAISHFISQLTEVGQEPDFCWSTNSLTNQSQVSTTSGKLSGCHWYRFFFIHS